MKLTNLHTGALLLSLTALLLNACTRTLTGCEGAALDLTQIDALRTTVGATGATASLVSPNPIDASGDVNITSTDSSLSKYMTSFNLPNMLSPNRLDGSTIKVRIHSTSDDVSTLATPNSSGQWDFQVSDPHYSEVMAYHSVNSISQYVQALGFTYLTDRPLYVLTQATVPGSASTQVNAYFQDNYINPTQPRIIYMVGATAFAPGMDRQMYWHEAGHWANESVSNQIGIDRAGEYGAFYTEGAALHEAMADTIAESLAGDPNIGVWVNRNFPGTVPGSPVRSAVDTVGNTISFSSVANQSNTGQYPERYAVGQWLERVLWDIRSQYVKEDSVHGSVFADRMFLSAVSLLHKDTSFTEFHNALQTADQNLSCGIHQLSIDNAFTSRGFVINPPQLSAGLAVTYTTSQLAAATGTTTSTGNQYAVSATITNSGSNTARNVRLVLQSEDARFQPVIYMQGYGDLPAGSNVTVGTSGLDIGTYAVTGQVSSGVPAGTQLKFRIIVQMENGPSTTQEGVLQL